MRAIAIDINIRVIISGSYDQTVRIWDIETGKCLHILEGHLSMVLAVCFRMGRIISYVPYIVITFSPNLDNNLVF